MWLVGDPLERHLEGCLLKYFKRKSLPTSEETGLGEAITKEANAAVEAVLTEDQSGGDRPKRKRKYTHFTPQQRAKIAKYRTSDLSPGLLMGGWDSGTDGEDPFKDLDKYDILICYFRIIKIALLYTTLKSQLFDHALISVIMVEGNAATCLLFRIVLKVLHRD